ncbi:MAG: hypothetical protein M3R70_03090 [Actinomycetota bacterium]|nr:hypothetical protein [Actinomycetota bacterium]
MRHRLAWVSGAIGGLAVVRLLRRRPKPVPGAEPDPRAEELRQKLDESREVVADPEELDEAETPVDEVEALPGDLDERRRQVHERARARAARMRSSSKHD